LDFLTSATQLSHFSHHFFASILTFFLLFIPYFFPTLSDLSEALKLILDENDMLKSSILIVMGHFADRRITTNEYGRLAVALRLLFEGAIATMGLSEARSRILRDIIDLKSPQPQEGLGGGTSEMMVVDVVRRTITHSMRVIHILNNGDAVVAAPPPSAAPGSGTSAVDTDHVRDSDDDEVTDEDIVQHNKDADVQVRVNGSTFGRVIVKGDSEEELPDFVNNTATHNTSVGNNAPSGTNPVPDEPSQFYHYSFPESRLEV
jgi:hypothetical protein